MHELIDRREAAKYAGVSMPTMYRWLTRGILDANGNRVRVARKRCGGRVYTTREWIDQFFEDLSRADTDRLIREEEKQSNQRKEQIERSRRSVAARR